MTERLVCPYCNASFRSPATYADHVKQHEKQPAATTMLTRKMEKLMAKTKRKGFMIDLSGQHGTFPQPASESVEDRMKNIRLMIQELNEIRKLITIPITVKSVRSSLKSWRTRRKLHNMFGVALN